MHKLVNYADLPNADIISNRCKNYLLNDFYYSIALL